jgi:glutamine cyclotransferase
LDWDGTHLWANRWQTDEIVRIDRRCRRVDAVVDGSSLVTAATDAARAAGTPVDVLNGIAHVPGTDRYLVTGKYWPEIYEVRFVSA